MNRIARLSTWKRHKRPRDGQSFARRTACLSDHSHASGLEARVCDELRLRKIAGDIKDYRREVTLQLELEGLRLGTYRVDFVVEHHDCTIEYVEAKGIEFQKWKRDWKILEHMNRDNKAVKMTVVRK